MRLRWLDRSEGLDVMRPMLSILTGRTLYGVRFGREQFKSFSERNQGKNGIPVTWWYFFGGRLSVMRKRLRGIER